MAVNKVVYGGETIVDLTADTVTADKVLKGYTAHDKSGNSITGTIETVEQATPSISVNTAGLMTAKSVQSTGYVEAGTKTKTAQLPTKAAQTITPGTSDQKISSGRYLTGTQTIKGDANLVAENIKKGVSIFGVSGSYEGTAGEDVTSETNEYTSLLTNLESAIDSLPDAGSGGGSGGGVEAWTGTVYGAVGILGSSASEAIAYVDENLTVHNVVISSREQVDITIAAHTLIAISGSYNATCENATVIEDYDMYEVYAVYPTANNFTINL